MSEVKGEQLSLAPPRSQDKSYMPSAKDENVSFREHFEELLANASQLQQERWTAHEKLHLMGQKALDAVLEGLRIKLEELNKVRQQALEDRRDFVRQEIYRSEYQTLAGKLDSDNDKILGRVGEMEQFRSNMEGRMWMLGAVLTAITIGLNLLFKYWGR